MVELSSSTFFRSSVKLEVDQQPQPVFNRNFELLFDHFEEQAKEQRELIVFSDNSKQIERILSISEDMGRPVKFEPIYKGLSGGFVDDEIKVGCYTEHQLFNRYYQSSKRKGYTKSQALTIKQLRDLNPGDFVVHIDHGVGKFQGLQKMEMGGKIQEAVRILYKNNDLLYVNIGSLHKISKFSGKEGHQPKLNKLGSDAWQKLKTKTKKKVKDIARDLIKLYAKRKAKPGYQFAPDSYLQTELEASFMFEDTPDQAKATEDVKKDMQSPHPMDRLVCGDVGFGKTEIAIRAAFKAVCDSKQVAILVPTTILAQQHYYTFKKRFEGFPVTVDYLNRFRTTKQQNATIKNMEEGKVDVVIGTHKLLGSKIKFKDLGLLIIDEEQKFGVGAKEKLKSLRVNVDTLTLTATPIPRTLHFSLMGARDLSIINTPPQNRRPIKTSLHVWNDEVIQEAVSHELNRQGQAFVVHNRVADIEDIAQKIRDLVPGARVRVGHGQMKGDELENVMVRFIEKEFDVLVATTIIESGLDIPNANTIIINNAHMFGLSDLHQMRGRVGRSNTKAYCYLLAPPLYGLPDDGRRRLEAIEQYSDLGGGFSIAMRDLDIRGAGNLLGAEQSGFISEIGFQMYHKILDEAIKELRDTEFKGVLKEESNKADDCVVETDMDIMIPDRYISNITERLSIYTELSLLKDPEKIVNFRDDLQDRFGRIPQSVRNLLQTIRIKWKASEMFISKVKIKGGKMLLYFSNDLDDSYYQTPRFGDLLQKVNNSGHKYRFKQTNTHLVLVIEEVENLLKAYSELENL